MTIKKISILGDYGRAGNKDPVERVDLAMGDVLSMVSPMAALEHSREIGQRYFFLRRICMLQSRHSDLVSAVAKRENGTRVRVEGIWIA